MNEVTPGAGAQGSMRGAMSDMSAMIERQQQTIAQQQLEIEALLELLIDKHVTSVGEFKAHMSKVRQRGTRSHYVHDALMAGSPMPAAGHAAVARPAPTPRPSAAPVNDGEPRRYTIG